MQTPGEFTTDREASTAAVRSRLGKLLRLRAAGAKGCALSFHDTFDWRLFAAGWVLEIERIEGNGYRARCRCRRHVEVRHQRLDAMSGRLDAWPDGPVRDLLKAIVGPRALIPVAELEGSRQHFSVLNGEEKIVSELFIDRWSVQRGTGRRRRSFDTWIRLSPLQGWEKETRRAGALLGAAGLRPASRSLLESALEGLDRKPLDYSSKFTIALSPADDAGAAVHRICERLFQNLVANEGGIRGAVDAECLHDFRVAVRRARVLLTQMKGVLRPEAAAPLGEELAWLGRETGAARDLDVQLLEFDGYKALLSRYSQADLEPLRPLLLHKQAEAAASVKRVLDGERYRRLLREWRRLLESPGLALEGREAARPVRDVAGRRIWALFRKIIRKGEAIDDDTASGELHELRKTCKKLRYLMEFFASLYPEKKVRRMIGQLKRLQDHLGEFQDQAVQMTALCDMSEEIRRQSPDSRVLLATGALIERIADRHARTRAQFAGRFEEFARACNRDLFAGVFKRHPGEEDISARRRALQH